jgi:hypothetical protein
MWYHDAHAKGKTGWDTAKVCDAFSLEYKTVKTPVKLPMSHLKDILCRRCDIRPVPPGYLRAVPPGYLRARRYLCVRCYRAMGKARRTLQWANGLRPSCRKHPNKTVNRSVWIARGLRKCSGCLGRNAKGEFRPTVSRHHLKRKRWRKTEDGRKYERSRMRLYRAKRK